MKTEINKIQIFEYFEGKSNLFARKNISEWLKTPSNQEQYYIWLEEYERNNKGWNANTATELLKITSKINQLTIKQLDETENVIGNQFLFNWKKVAAAAAVIFIVLGFSLKNQILYKTYNTDFGIKETIKLEDGSLVNLNANSSLKIPRFGFGKNERRVELIGEAFFNVTHTKSNQKFIVDTDKNFSVEVLGTEFDVFNRNNQKQVVLEKGKVKIHYGAGKEQITMKPGDKVTMNESGKTSIEFTSKPKNYSSWKNNLFVFNKTSLKEVGEIIKQNFGKELIIHDSLASRTLSGEIVAKNEGELIEALSQVFDLNIVIKNKTIEVN